MKPDLSKPFNIDDKDKLNDSDYITMCMKEIDYLSSENKKTATNEESHGSIERRKHDNFIRLQREITCLSMLHEHPSLVHVSSFFSVNK